MHCLLFTWLDTRGAEKMRSYFSTSFDPGQHLSVQAVSTLLGIVEIAIAVMIAMRPVATKISAPGGSDATAIKSSAHWTRICRLCQPGLARWLAGSCLAVYTHVFPSPARCARRASGDVYRGLFRVQLQQRIPAGAPECWRPPGTQL